MQATTKGKPAPGERELPHGQEAPLPDVGDAYDLVRKLGEGGMATVYEGVQRALGRSVAVKLLHPDRAARQVIRDRFLREARTLARIQSPHVVSVTDFGQTSAGVPFLVMELLVGEDLRRLLERERRLSVPRAARLVQQACWGIARAHALAVVHRDLKPENLFVVQPGVGPELCKVIDFGVVRQQDASAALTRDGDLVGTVRYMAPEQARAQPVDARVDIYTLGAILYEMLGGAPLFAAQSNEVLLFQIMNEAPAPLRALCPELPEGLAQVLERALDKDREKRFPNALELAAALEHWSAAARDASEVRWLAPTATPGAGVDAQDVTRVDSSPSRAGGAARGGAELVASRRRGRLRELVRGLAWAVAGGALSLSWPKAPTGARVREPMPRASLISAQAPLSASRREPVAEASGGATREAPAPAPREPSASAASSPAELGSSGSGVGIRAMPESSAPPSRALLRGSTPAPPRARPTALPKPAALEAPALAASDEAGLDAAPRQGPGSPSAQGYITDNPYAVVP